MTKEQLQKELLEKVKPGVKASNLKKLKHSKSEGDLPNPSSAKSVPLTRTNSNQRSILELKLETKDRELIEKAETIESLRTQLDQTHQKLTSTTQKLDNSLLARYEALKQFDKVHTKLQLVKQELDDNIDQASNELLTQDQTITKLRTNQQKAQQRIQSLEKDLNLTQRLAKLRDFSLPDDYPTANHLKYALYTLCAVGFALFLVNNLKNKEIK